MTTGGAPRVLHLHSTFSPGGKELRCVQLINAFGPQLAHTVVSAEPGALGAAERISRNATVAVQPEFPSLTGAPTPWRLFSLARAMKGYDLVLTYNWGAMDAVMAHRMFGGVLRLPPLIHHEDGFDESERDRRSPKRNAYRRLAVTAADMLVVPSATLETIARDEWGCPARRIRRIPNGIDTAAFVSPPDPAAIPGLRKTSEVRWVGTLAGLRPVKNLPRLVRAFAALAPEWELVICGEGPERDAIAAAAKEAGIAGRVHLPGNVPEPAKVMGLFDIFALSSDSEQFPISVVEAMAAGLPVCAPEVGDIAAMLAGPNRANLAAQRTDAALSASLAAFAEDPQLRADVGRANRAKAQQSFGQDGMIAAYSALYFGAMDRA